MLRLLWQSGEPCWKALLCVFHMVFLSCLCTKAASPTRSRHKARLCFWLSLALLQSDHVAETGDVGWTAAVSPQKYCARRTSWRAIQLLCMPADVLHHSGHRAARHSSPQCRRPASLPLPVLDLPSRCQCHPSVHPQVLPLRHACTRPNKAASIKVVHRLQRRLPDLMTQGMSGTESQSRCVLQMWLVWQIWYSLERVLYLLQIWLAGVHAHSQQLQHLCRA